MGGALPRPGYATPPRARVEVWAPVAYLVAVTAWLLLSGALASSLSSTRAGLAWVELGKGLFFAGASAAALHLFLRHLLARPRAPGPPPAAQDALVAALEAVSEPLLVVQRDVVAYANRAAASLLKAEGAEDVVGRRLDALVARADGALLAEALTAAGPRPRFVALRLLGLDGLPHAVEAGLATCAWRGEEAVQLVLVDVSRTRRLLDEAQQVKQGLGLQSTSAAAAHATSAAALAHAVCRATAQEPGVAMSWLGVADAGAPGALRALASYGVDPEPLKRLLAPATRPLELAGALRDGHPWLVDDLTRDAVAEVAREEALRCGLATLLVVPLVSRGEVLGALALASRERAAFDAADVRRVEALGQVVAAGLAESFARPALGPHR